MIQDSIIALFIAFAISALVAKPLIAYLRKLKFGQTEREDGPQSHLKKNGTPTMGGVIFLLGIVVSSICFIGKYPRLAPVLFVTVGFGLVGFIDDYIKVVMKRSDGMRGDYELRAESAFLMRDSADGTFGAASSTVQTMV